VMIDVAEKQLNIPIRKKAGTKQWAYFAKNSPS
jgi:hypothetical protein